MKRKFGGRTSKAEQVPLSKKVAIIQDWKKSGCKKSYRELERDHGVSYVSCGNYIRDREALMKKATMMSECAHRLL